MSVIAVENLYAGYVRDNPVLHGLTFSVGKGNVFIVAGPNGAGKTTLFRVLTGILRPFRGSVEVMGRDPYTDPEARRFIGYLPEASRVYGVLTVEENLMFFANIYGVSRERVYEVMRLVGIEGYRSRRAEELSQGLRRRLSLAIALLHNPDILILDEPFKDLDVESSSIVREIIRGVSNEGKTIVISTHRVEEIELMSYTVHESKMFVMGLSRGRCLGIYRYSDLRSMVKEVEVAIRVPREKVGLALATLRSMGVEILEYGERHIVVKALDPEKDVPRIVKELSDRGVEVLEIRALRTPLEKFIEILRER